MIIAWMLSALLFAAFVAVVAASVDMFTQALGRPTRWIWTTALVVGALWPVVVSIAARVLPRLHEATARLAVVSVVPDGTMLLGRSSADALVVAGRLMLGLWVLASTLLAMRLARAVASTRRLRSSAERGTVDGVQVLISESHGPATIGLREPAVIVPRSLLELDEPLRRLVLRHEREHCEARDPSLLLGAAIAVVLFPWNAALWFIVRRLHLALEIDCDARVLSAEADVSRYGRLLLWVAQRRTAIPLAPMLAASPSHLERRIIAMRTRLARPRPLHLAAACALLAVGIVGACSEGVPDAPSAQRSARQQSASAQGPTEAKSPYFEFQVEGQARQIPGTGIAKYPPAMRLANREGDVLAQFVVRENGVPDVNTFKVLKSSDPAFTAAVHSALSTMRFEPARVGGAAVSQVVQLPFTFSLRGS